MGEDLRVETLREAYRKGIFPWPHDGLPLPWFSPRRRAVIFFDELHVGRSLRKAQKRARIHVHDRSRFPFRHRGVCRGRPSRAGRHLDRADHDPRRTRASTMPAMRTASRCGRTTRSSADCTASTAGGVFTGESMFHRRPDASKLALLFLIDHLRARGATFLDCQVMTPHMEALGAREISRARFLDALAEAQAKALSVF